jgi:hypothetical protein
MQADELEIGRFYAYREGSLTSGDPLKVKLLEKIGRGGKVKIRFEDGPHPGLDEYVRTRQLIVPWGQRKALLRDEERAQRLSEHHARTRPAQATAHAIGQVLASSGEPGAWCEPSGLSMEESELQRIVDRAGLEQPLLQLHGLAYRDRRGYVHLPVEAAETVARAFAAAEPETVLMAIEDRESELKAGGYAPGDRYKHELLREYGPSFALARQWAGFDRDLERLQQEIGRLRGLVSRAASDLKTAGKEGKARSLLRALDGR